MGRAETYRYNNNWNIRCEKIDNLFVFSKFIAMLIHVRIESLKPHVLVNSVAIFLFFLK